MRLSSDGVFFFPKPYPNTINKKKHTQKKEGKSPLHCHNN